jgi:hypothetical protein
MAKKKKSEEVVADQQAEKSAAAPKSLGIKVRLEKSISGRLTVTVKLLDGDNVIAEDYDFVQVD